MHFLICLFLGISSCFHSFECNLSLSLFFSPYHFQQTEQLVFICWAIVKLPRSISLLVLSLGQSILLEFLSRQIFGAQISETKIKVVNHFLSIKQFCLRAFSESGKKAELNNFFKRMCFSPALPTYSGKQKTRNKENNFLS